MKLNHHYITEAICHENCNYVFEIFHSSDVFHISHSSNGKRALSVYLYKVHHFIVAFNITSFQIFKRASEYMFFSVKSF